MIDEQYQAKQADLKAKQDALSSMYKDQSKLIANYHSGDMPISKFYEEYDKIWGAGKHLQLPTNMETAMPYMLQKANPPNPSSAGYSHLNWKVNEAAEKLKEGKITKEEYGKIWQEAEDKKDQYFGGILTKAINEKKDMPIEDIYKGILKYNQKNTAKKYK
jgi:hypothetical protein